MSTVTAAWTRVVVDYAASQGLDPQPTLAAVGVAREHLGLPDARIAAVTDDAVWARLADELGDPDLGVHLSERAMSAGGLGWLGYRARASRDVAEALAVAQRHQAMLKDEGGLSLRDEGRLLVAIERPGARPWARPVAEAILANIVTLGRAWTGVALRPRAVGFQHRRPARAAELERFFGCPIAFGQPENRVVFDQDVTQLPLVTHEPELAAYLEAAARPRAPGGADDELRAAIAEALGDGEPGLPAIARRLGTTGRTLQRRLADRGTSFRAIVDDVRRAEAAAMLARGDRLAAIAERLGFSEPRAFRRAYRRWTGEAPSAARVARSVPVLARRVLDAAGADE